MKTNKLKIFSLMAFVALMSVAMVFAANRRGAAKPAVAAKKATTYYFHYMASGTDLTSYKTAANWEQVADPDDPGCLGTAKPCVVQSSQSTVSAFVGSITQISDVTGNTVRTKN
jgi:hypothetical protein